jgi:hypothetical protein
MPRYLVYIDCADRSIIDDAFEKGLDNCDIDEYYTLTEDGAPIVFEDGEVSCPEFCNGLAIRCAGITEE